MLELWLIQRLWTKRHVFCHQYEVYWYIDLSLLIFKSKSFLKHNEKIAMLGVKKKSIPRNWLSDTTESSLDLLSREIKSSNVYWKLRDWNISFHAHQITKVEISYLLFKMQLYLNHTESNISL